MVIYFSLVVALIGVLMYGFCSNPKLAMLGLIGYGCGVLAFLLGFTGHSLSLLH